MIVMSRRAKSELRHVEATNLHRSRAVKRSKQVRCRFRHLGQLR